MFYDLPPAMLARMRELEQVSPPKMGREPAACRVGARLTEEHLEVAMN
jgi:hypothetical protein